MDNINPLLIYESEDVSMGVDIIVIYILFMSSLAWTCGRSMKWNNDPLYLDNPVEETLNKEKYVYDK